MGRSTIEKADNLIASKQQSNKFLATSVTKKLDSFKSVFIVCKYNALPVWIVHKPQLPLSVIEAPALSQTRFFPAGGVVGALLFSARLRSLVCDFFTLSNPLLLMIEKQEIYDTIIAKQYNSFPNEVKNYTSSMEMYLFHAYTQDSRQLC